MASIYATLSERKLNGENLMRSAGSHDRNTLATKAMARCYTLLPLRTSTTTEAVLSQKYTPRFST